jgi:Ricin-type beta-trefoil lectin domain
MPLPTAFTVYYIRSDMSQEDVSFGMAIAREEVNYATAILSKWDGGQTQELWYLQPGMTIQNAYNNYYLAPGEVDSALVLSSDPYNWTLTEEGLLLTPTGDYVVSVNEAVDPPLVILRPVASNQGHRWRLFPNMFRPQPKSVYGSIQTKLTPNGPFREPMVLNIEDGYPVGGQKIILYPLAAGGSNALWRMTDDGHIQSGLGAGLVLDAGPDAQSGTQLVVNPWVYPAEDTQIWSVKDGVITNKATSLVVNVAGDNTQSLTPVILWDLEQDGQKNNEIFYFNAPRQPLHTIMRMAPTPFPPFAGEEQQAYTFINQSLGLGPEQHPPMPLLRENYGNLDLPDLMSQWAMSISAMVPPEGMPSESWNAVVKQLTSELAAAPVVQQLFANIITYLEASLSNNEATFNQIVDLLSLPDQAETLALSWIGSLVEGIIYTAVSAVPVASGVNLYGVAANIMSTIYSTVMSGLGGNAPPADAFQVAYAKLWGTISANFESMVGTTEVIASSIFADWGKLNATYLKCLTPGPAGLSWPNSLTGTLIDQASAAFTKFLLNTLIPVQNQIYMIPSGIDKSPGPSPWTDSQGNIYFLAQSEDWSSSPAAEFFAFLANNVSLQDMYLGLSGWTIPVAVIGDVGNDDLTNVVITNQTGNLLTLSIDNDDTVYALAPDQSSGFQVNAQTNELDQQFTRIFSISDPNIGNDPVVTFNLNQTWLFAEGGWPQLSNITTASGYATSPNPICNQASYNDKITGAVQITLFRPQPPSVFLPSSS